MTHTHSVVDTDPHFIIDENSRAITFSGELPTIVQHDHNSERFTFEMPQMIDGHDMTLCNKVRVHYINIDASTKETNSGVYEVDDLATVENDDSRVAFSWLISTNATKFSGKLNFKVQFLCVENDVITYAWNTGINSDLTVGAGMDSSEAVAEEYADILAKWESDIESLRDFVTSLNDRVDYLYENSGNGTVNSVNGVGPDENGDVQIEIPDGFSGSWNDLQDRPFYDESLIHVPIPGEDSVAWYMVSEDIPSGDYYTLNAGCTIVIDGQKINKAIMMATEDFYVSDQSLVVVALKDNAVIPGIEAVLPKRGAYFVYGAGAPLISGFSLGENNDPEITWDGNTGTLKTLDEKFIPTVSGIIVKSSTADSTKKFKITVDDNGTISATELT